MYKLRGEYWWMDFFSLIFYIYRNRAWDMNSLNADARRLALAIGLSAVELSQFFSGGIVFLYLFKTPTSLRGLPSTF